MYFAEVMVPFTVCANGAALFGLGADELFQCELDVEAYRDLARRLQAS